MQLLTSNFARKLQAIRHGSAFSRPYIFRYDQVLGTSLDLHVRATSAHSAKRAEDEVLIEIDRLENILSGQSPTSEFSRWRAERGDPTLVSPELADVLRRADAWRTITGKAFDPAAQEIIDALDEKAVGSADDLHAGHGRLWLVDIAESTAWLLTRSSISLDAIAKGYIVAQAAARGAEVEGVTAVLVNIGGHIQHFGARPTVIGIQDPFASEDNSSPVGAVRIQNGALATSAGYRRGFMTHGRRLPSIIDTRSGKRVEHIASASVFAPNCATADALSTAFRVMQPRESIALADSLPDVGCMLVEQDGTIRSNSAWMDRAVYTDQRRVA